MTASEFIRKWKDAELSERSACQQHFLASALILFLILTHIYGFQSVLAHERPAGGNDERVLRLLSGPEDGEYYRLGNAMAERLISVGIRVRVFPSRGSSDNLRAIREGTADLALVQSNILADSDASVKPIASLTTEKAHIVSGRSLAILELQQIAGKRVFIGLPGSGSRGTALDILGAAGVSLHEVEAIACSSYTEALSKVEDGEIDIAFFTISHPATILKESLARRRTRLLPLNKSIVKRLLSRFPHYVSADIPSAAYGLDSDVPTIGVRAVLVAGLGVTDDQAYTIAATVFSDWEAIAGELGYAVRLSVATAQSGIERPLHSGSQKYFSENRFRSFFPKLDRSWMAIFVFLGAIIYILGWRRSFLRAIWRQPVLASVLALVLAWLLGAIGMYIAEHHVNEDFDPLTEALWSVVVYLFSGFEDKYPLTEAGRVVTVGIMLMGAACLAVITASIAATLTKRRLEGRRMPGRLKDHFVICNCDNRIFSVVRELQSKNPEEKVPIVIVSTRRDVRLHGRKEDDQFLEDVFSVYGDPTDPRVLRRVNAQDASCVIILAQRVHVTTGDGDSAQSETELDEVAADARSLMTLLAMKKICREVAKDPNSPRYVNCVVEILDPRNMEMAWEIGTREDGQEPGVDVESLASGARRPVPDSTRERGFYGANRWVQVVSAAEIQTLLLCQAAHTPGLVTFYRRLMTYTGETNEVYMVRMPRPLYEEETNFQEAVAWITMASRDTNPTIPVGIQHPDGSQKTNPTGTTVLDKDDRLIVISFREPDLEHLDTSLLADIRARRP